MSKVAVIVGEEFEEAEVVVVSDYLVRAGIEVQLLAVGESMKIEGAHGLRIQCDKLLWEAKPKKFDAVYLPGGPGVEALKEDEDVEKFVKKAKDHDALIAALCAAPALLDRYGMVEDEGFVIYPGMEKDLSKKPKAAAEIAVEGDIITGSGPAFAQEMAFAIIRALDEKKVEDVKKDTLYDKVVAYRKEAE